MRRPSGDQPGAGGKVRGLTGLSSSRQRIVAPSGGSVYRVTIRALLGQTPDQDSLLNCEDAATALLLSRGCVGSGCAPPGCPSRGPLAPFIGLAKAISKDRAAVEAGLTMPWSTSTVEGHVNRVKLIKRQGYG